MLRGRSQECEVLRALRDEAPIEPADFRKTGLYTFAFAASCVGAPNALLRDKNSPYRFLAKQVGRHSSALTARLRISGRYGCRVRPASAALTGAAHTKRMVAATA